MLLFRGRASSSLVLRPDAGVCLPPLRGCKEPMCLGWSGKVGKVTGHEFISVKEAQIRWVMVHSNFNNNTSLHALYPFIIPLARFKIFQSYFYSFLTTCIPAISSLNDAFAHSNS